MFLYQLPLVYFHAEGLLLFTGFLNDLFSYLVKQIMHKSQESLDLTWNTAPNSICISVQKQCLILSLYSLNKTIKQWLHLSLKHTDLNMGRPRAEQWSVTHPLHEPLLCSCSAEESCLSAHRGHLHDIHALKSERQELRFTFMASFQTTLQIELHSTH